MSTPMPAGLSYLVTHYASTHIVLSIIDMHNAHLVPAGEYD